MSFPVIFSGQGLRLIAETSMHRGVNFIADSHLPTELRGGQHENACRACVRLNMSGASIVVLHGQAATLCCHLTMVIDEMGDVRIECLSAFASSGLEGQSPFLGARYGRSDELEDESSVP